jgi:hypothetical protein
MVTLKDSVTSIWGITDIPQFLGYNISNQDTAQVQEKKKNYKE